MIHKLIAILLLACCSCLERFEAFSDDAIEQLEGGAGGVGGVELEGGAGGVGGVELEGGAGGVGGSGGADGGGGAPPCTHDKCAPGPPLAPQCDPCVLSICTIDPYCCAVSWDTACTSQVATICAVTCP